jgi:hypothetical protein
MNTTVKGLSPLRLLTLVALVFTIFCFVRESRAQTQIIPQNQLSITGVDSEQDSYYRAANSIDGKQIPCGTPHGNQVATLCPHQITLQLSTSYIVHRTALLTSSRWEQERHYNLIHRVC